MFPWFRSSRPAVFCGSVAILFATASSALPAQTIAPAPVTPTSVKAPVQPSLNHLYMHFFLYEAHLQRVTQAHTLRGATPVNFEDHLRRTIGLTEAEWLAVAAFSSKMETKLNGLRAEAQIIAAPDRAAYKSGSLPLTAPPPSLPALHKLEGERQRSLKNGIEQLETQIGPDASAKLKAYIQNTLATRVRVVPITEANIRAARLAKKAASK